MKYKDKDVYDINQIILQIYLGQEKNTIDCLPLKQKVSSV